MDYVIVDDDSPAVVVVGDDPELVIPDASGPGPRGDPGASAYQGWLGAGHSGTEADYQDWLKADASGLVQQHVAAPLPHPAYDDMADLTLLFENGLV